MKTKKLSIAVVGASGRMGQLIAQCVVNAGHELAAAVVGYRSSHLTHPVPMVAGLGYQSLKDVKWQGVDVIIDFSNPEGLADIYDEVFVQGHKPAYLCGTTGLTAQHHDILHKIAQHSAVLQTNNTSVGVHILADLVQRAAQKCPDYDIEIVEMHHRQKKDSPSGTALLLGRAAAKGRGVDLDSVRIPPHDGISTMRENGKIGFASLRGGQVIGDHSVILAGMGEVITLSHRATDRVLFADGAVKIATWLAHQTAGLYNMQDFIHA